MNDNRSCLAAPPAPAPAKAPPRFLGAALALLTLAPWPLPRAAAQTPNPVQAVPAPPAGGPLVSMDAPGAPAPLARHSGEPAKLASKAHLGLAAFVRGIQDVVAARGRAAVRGSDLSTPRFRVRDDLKVQVDLYCSAWTDAERAALERLGMEIGPVATRPYVVVEGWIPYDQVAALDALSFVKEAVPPAYPIASVGSVTAESDATMGTADARARLGFDGSGIRVGVISNSSSPAARDAARATSASGDDLPAESRIFIPVDKDGSGNVVYVHDGTKLTDGSPNPNNINEGTAMMEIVHDMVPGAPLAFWGTTSAADMANGIRRLASEGGCQVIVDDMTMFTEPCFAPGIVEQAIDDVTAAGVTYLTSAGNFAMLHYGGAYNGHTSNVLGFSGASVHQFRNNSTGALSDLLPIILPAANVDPKTGAKTNGTATVMLQWDDPWGAANSDYDLFFTDDPAGRYYMLQGADPQAGSGNPWETITVGNTNTSNITGYIVIRKKSGYDRNLSLWVFGGAVARDYASADHSIGFNNKAKNALSVAAIDANAADAPGTGSRTYDQVEPSSSRGPVQLSYPSAQTLNKPEISGSDGLQVTGAGGFPNPFYGTSAAAPAVAGVAAQLLSARPDLGPATVKRILTGNTIDYGDAGYDFTYGYGLADARPMLDAARIIYVKPTAPSPTPDGLSWDTAYKRLVDAIPSARAGDEVWCAYGDYNLAPYHLPAGVKLYGGFAGVETAPSQRLPNGSNGRSIIEPSALSGAATGSGVVVDAPVTANPPETVIDGFTIRNNIGSLVNGQRYGGGVYTNTTPVTVANNVFDGNSADFGAGVFVSAPASTVTDNTFTNNTATSGGAGAYLGGTAARLLRNTFLANSAPNGAAVYVSGGAPSVRDNVIARNSASQASAGVYVWNGSTADVVNNTIAYNNAPSGAGITVDDTANPTIANNIVAFNASGIRAGHTLAAPIRSNDVYGNGSANYAGSFLDATGQNGNIAEDPRFLGGYVVEPDRYRLQLFSPAADAGDNTAVLAGETDHDNKPRIQPAGDAVDMGAYEIPAPKIVRVSPSGSDGNDGSAWSLPMRSVGAAIGQLNGPGEVWIAAGTYPDTHVTLPGGVRLYGGFAGSETLRRQRDWTKNVAILDGSASAGRVISIARYADATTAVDGLTIQGGDAGSGLGGGIGVDTDASPLIANNRIRNNHAQHGGGIRLAERGAAVVRYNAIVNNRAEGNGGGMDYYQCQPTVVGNAFSGNTATNGGAFSNVQSKAYVFGNTMVGNTATQTGTVYVSGGDPSILNNVITGNVDDGIYIESSAGRIADNNISVNTGSGVWAYQASPTVVNNTIVENGSYGGTNGGVVSNYGSSLTLANNLIAYNGAGVQSQSGGALSLTANDVFGNAAYQYSAVPDQTGANGNLSADPKIARDARGVFHLQPESPLIGAGNASALAADDQDIDSQPRTRGGAVDIGADEADGTAWTPNATVVRVSPAGSDANDGSSWTAPKATIQAAIDQAGRTGGDVWVKAGTYNERITLRLGVQVYGGFAGTETARAQRDYRKNVTTLDGQQAGSVVSATGSLPVSTVLDGFILRNGKSASGGGVYLNGVSVTVRNNVITRNQADDTRGGIAVFGQAPAILSNTVTGNAGWGIAMNDSAARVSGNVLTTNAGGGLYTYQSSPRVVNNTIVENGGNGGLMADYGSNVAVTNNIIAYNASGAHSASGGAASFANNDVFGNTAYQYGGWPDQTGANGNISADPRMARDAIGNLHIQPGSPCKDAGTGAALSVVDADIDGQTRTQGAAVDIGADETDGASYPMPNSYVVRVSPTGSDANDGSSWTAPKATIQAAIDQAAVHGGDVWVQAGAYNEHVTLRYGVQLYGGFAGSETLRQDRNPRTNVTTINGSGAAGSVVTVGLLQSNATVIDGFTITGGSTDNGGGVRSDSSSATIRDNTITGNVATNAGGGLYLSGCAPLVLNNTITGNAAGYGGAIDIENASPRIADNTIAVNRVTAEGAGIRGYYANPVVVNNTIAENNGGAGLVVNYGSIYTVANNVIAYNAGGAQSLSGGAASFLHNDVFANTQFNYTGWPDQTGANGNISADPLMVRDGRGNLEIRPGSPVINAGDGSFVLPGETDVDGRARILGGSVDIGAVESDGTVWPVTMRAFYVRPDGSDANDGTTWAKAKKTVQAGIEAAYAQGGEVWVKAGAYTERITLRQGVTVYGGFTGTETLRGARNWKANRTVLDGTGATPGPVVTAPAGISQSAALDGFTITNGANDNGAIHTEWASPTFRNNLVTRNATTGSVGGFWIANGAPTLVSNVIAGNAGDGVYATNATPRIANNVIANNTRAAIEVYQSNPAIVSNTIVENGWTEGAVYIDYASNATIANNIVAFNARGIRSASGGAATFANNDVFGNFAWGYAGWNDPTGTGGNLSADPKLARDADGTLHIQPDSPARDAGTPAAVVSGETDIDSQPRVQGASVDIGADESDGTAWVPSAIVVRVKPSGDDAKDGASWANAKRTVQAAINALAQGGGEVWAAAGSYNERITLKQGVAVYGGFAGTETAREARSPSSNVTVLDGTGLSGAVVVASGSLAPSATLDGFTITHGTADTTTNNNGGGIYVDSAAPTLRNDTVAANSAPNAGGGIFLTSAHGILLAANVVANNTSSNSGGVYVEYSSGPRLADCLLYGNAGGDAGALKAYQSTLTVANNTIADNNGNGAVVADYATTIALANTIIADNQAGVRAASGGGFVFDSNDVFGNTNGNFLAYSDPTGTNGNVSTDPLFADRAARDYHLVAASPVRDRGDDAAVLPGERDMAGQPRILGAHVDMGAYESAGAAPFSLADAITALKAAAGLAKPDAAEVTRLNVETGEISAGRLDMRDAARLARKAAGRDPNP